MRIEGFAQWLISSRRRSVYRTVNKKSMVEEELFGNTGMRKSMRILCLKIISIDLDPLTLPIPSSNARFSNAKVTVSLRNPHERPTSSVFFEQEKRYPLPQTFSSQIDQKIRRQRELERSKSAHQILDTT